MPRVARAGVPLTEEQRRLAEQWTGLVVFALNRYRAAWASLDHDEALAVGHLALVRAAGKFDPARGVKFKTYAVTAIVHAFHTAGRACRHATGEREPLDDLADCRRAGAEPDEAALVREALRTLDRRYRRVVEMRRDGVTLREIAARLGISKERVRQIQNKAYAKLREALAGLAEGVE